ncbi:hypothetical protein ACIHFD_63445 [Nonomuraea sp. NPDC051941]|uniref:hypothetical protein n=1 Tax=Nonomuraea sp. NPDC051941 TaxID=3364373 RepID=UPI0037C5D431
MSRPSGLAGEEAAGSRSARTGGLAGGAGSRPRVSWLPSHHAGRPAPRSCRTSRNA